METVPSRPPTAGSFPVPTPARTAFALLEGAQPAELPPPATEPTPLELDLRPGDRFGATAPAAFRADGTVDAARVLLADEAALSLRRAEGPAPQRVRLTAAPDALEALFRDAMSFLQSLESRDGDSLLRLDAAPPARFASGHAFVARLGIRGTAIQGFALRAEAGPARDASALRVLPESGAALMRLYRLARAAATSPSTRVPARRHRRVPARLAVRLHLAQGVERAGVAADLSEEGLFVLAPWLLARGRPVEVSFRPPFSLRRVRLPATVAWRRGGSQPGLGLRLELRGDEDRRQVRALLDRFARRAAPRG